VFYADRTTTAGPRSKITTRSTGPRRTPSARSVCDGRFSPPSRFAGCPCRPTRVALVGFRRWNGPRTTAVPFSRSSGYRCFSLRYRPVRASSARRTRIGFYGRMKNRYTFCTCDLFGEPGMPDRLRPCPAFSWDETTVYTDLRGRRANNHWERLLRSDPKEFQTVVVDQVS